MLVNPFRNALAIPPLRRVWIFLGLALLMQYAHTASASNGNEDLEMQSTRPFLMGFTPFHFSWIEDRISETYSMIYAHSDILAYHFDEGVPWPEALSNRPYHPNVESELAHRKEQLSPGAKVYVATTPINFERKGLADYWEEKAQVKRPDGWQNKRLDDPEVIRAYIQYCERLIDTFNPEYFVYGVEVNLLAANNPDAYKRFQTLAAAVYPALKKKYPNLPVALSFYLHAPDRLQETRELVTPLLPYTDLYAVSTYPYMAYEADGFPVDEIPEDWLKQTRQIAPGKPFAIAENGYIAEDMKVFGKKMPGSADAQKRYTQRMLREAAELDAEFVVWFVIADYDELWGVLKWAVMFNPLMRAWKDTGLFDGDLKPRPALQVWDEWLAKPRKR
ncbi:MAG: hypothetical protein KDI09_03755 [Halioglobus sp.]|nr:hypothetical protein [Halioglobus sp.]